MATVLHPPSPMASVLPMSPTPNYARCMSLSTPTIRGPATATPSTTTRVMGSFCTATVVPGSTSTPSSSLSRGTCEGSAHTYTPLTVLVMRSQGLGGGTEKRVNNKLLVSSIHPGPSL